MSATVRPRGARLAVVSALAVAMLGAGSLALPGSPLSPRDTVSAQSSSTAVLAGAEKALGCPEAGQTYWKFHGISTQWVPTNVRSDWAKPGVTINYTKSTTGTASAEMSATVGAEAGVIFAKASVEVGVTVGGSWSKTDQWSYETTVPKKANGKKVQKARLMMFHQAKKFTATKYRHVTNPTTRSCGVKKVKRLVVTAPVKKNSNTWGLQYRYQ